MGAEWGPCSGCLLESAGTSGGVAERMGAKCGVGGRQKEALREAVAAAGMSVARKVGGDIGPSVGLRRREGVGKAECKTSLDELCDLGGRGAGVL